MKMNTAQFMDKQIMDLSASGSGKPATAAGEEFLLDLVNSHLRQAAAGESDADAIPPPPPRFGYGENNHNSSVGGYEGEGERVEEEEEEEEIVPSYDFHPIRPLDSAAPRVWASADSKSSPSFPKSYGSFDPAEKVKVTAGGSIDMAGIVSEVDHAMKKHTDNLLHALEGISARLTQLETRTRGLESSVDDLKVSVGNNHGSTDGKMRQLENILREVQAGVHVIKDKQETMETQLQLAKMHVSKSDQPQPPPPPPERQNTMNMDATLQAASAPPQSHQQLHSPVPFLHAAPPGPHPPPLISPAASHQNLPPSGPHPSQFPQTQIPPMPQRDSYYPPPGQTQEAPSQQYHQVPSSQPPQPPPTALPHPSHAPPTQLSAAAAPHQPYPPAPPQSLYSHQSLPPQPQPSQGHHQEEAPYPPTQSFPPNVHQPTSQPPGGAPPPSQQFYGAPPSVYEAPSGRQGSSFPASYGGQPSGPTEPYPYGGSASQYGGRPAVKQQQFSPPPVAQGGGGGYPQLPTARILPQALPTASGIDGGGSSPTGTGNRVPLDDVVDRVTSMGFSREQVRATVRRLTENGQSVDLNIVLDKLMNDGEGPTQRGWYGR